MDNKIGLGIVFAGLLGVIAWGSYKVNTVKENVNDKLNETLASINESLPAGYMAVLENKKSMMGNKGFYSMRLANSGLGVDSIVLNFDISYGPMDLLLNRLSVKTDLKLTGGLIDKYKLTDYSFLNTVGHLGDSYIDVKLSANPLVLNEPGLFSLNASGMNGKFYKEKTKGILNFNYVIPMLDIAIPSIGGVAVKGMSYMAVLDGGTKATGYGSMGIESIKSIQGGLDGFLVSYSTKLKADKYDVSAGIAIQNLDFGKTNKGNMDIQYSLNGLLRTPLDHLITRYEDGYLLPSATSATGLAKEDVSSILQIINGGFVVSMDKFAIQSNLGNVSAKMLGKLKPSTSNDISFVDDFEYAFVASGSGSMLDGMVESKIGQSIIKSEDGTYKNKNEYKDRQYLVNGVVDVTQTQSFIKKLNEWDDIVIELQKMQ